MMHERCAASMPQNAPDSLGDQCVRRPRWRICCKANGARTGSIWSCRSRLNELERIAIVANSVKGRARQGRDTRTSDASFTCYDKCLDLVFVTALGLAVAGQAPSPQAGRGAAAEPTLEQMRRTVATLRGNRIATPNDYDTLKPEQQAYVRSILSGPRASITGPLGVMMVSPTLGDLMQKATAYARFAGDPGFSSVSPKYNELAILVVAKHWSAEYVWNAHHAYGVRMGLPAELVEAIRTGGRPPRMDKELEAVYAFATEFIPPAA